jgi:hypothetical protein
MELLVDSMLPSSGVLLINQSYMFSSLESSV